MVKKLVENKMKAFEKATEQISKLKSSYNLYIQRLYGNNINPKFIGLNSFDVTKFIFENDYYYEYVKYALLGKYYSNKINGIKTYISVFFIITMILLNLFIRPIFIPLIITVILVYLLFYILKRIGGGESFISFYQRTLVNFLYKMYPNIVFSEGLGFGISTSDLISIIGKSYDEKRVISNINYKGSLFTGSVCDLELYDVTEVRDSDGDRREVRTKIFDGFALKVDMNNKIKLMKGNTIKIKADENIFSHLAEDTVKGIYENEKEFSFNAEEMNKSFDGRITGYKGFNSVDDALIVVKKIITPSFESHLLYLRERYNSFNMNISDDGFGVSINMTRNLLQTIKHKELDFKRTYREANEQFKPLFNDFTYHKIFPFMERLYLINYLSYLYLSYTDFENYYDLNNESINSYEEKMREIIHMDHKDFSKLYLDKIENLEKETKNFALIFEKEER